MVAFLLLPCALRHALYCGHIAPPPSRPTHQPRASMRIDAYTHFIPEKYFAKMLEGDHKDIGKRVREVPCIHDLDVRLKIVDMFDDYAQILSYPMPPPERMYKPEQLEDMIRLVNDGFAEIVAERPDRFPGFVVQAALLAPDGGVREAERVFGDD